MGNLGASEVLLIILVALLLFGAGRLADIGRGLGEGIRSFKQGLKEGAGRRPGKVATTERARTSADPGLRTMPVIKDAELVEHKGKPSVENAD